MGVKPSLALLALLVLGCASRAASVEAVTIPKAAPASSVAESAQDENALPPKRGECDALIAKINATVSALGKHADAAQDSGSGIAELEAMAVTMDAAARDLADLQPKHRELAALTNEYRAMTIDVARVARSMAVAARATDATKVAAAQKAMERAVAKEDPIVNRINAYCESP